VNVDLNTQELGNEDSLSVKRRRTAAAERPPFMPLTRCAFRASLRVLHSVASPHGCVVRIAAAAHNSVTNNRRLQATIRSSRLPMVKQLGDFDITFQ
jgi:hypothetical protein